MVVFLQIGEIAERAPKVIEENVPVVEGLAKTIQETSGFVGGVLANTTQIIVKAGVDVAGNAGKAVQRTLDITDQPAPAT